MSRMLLLSLSLLFIAILFLGCADIPEETTNMSPQNPTMTTNTPIQIPTDAKSSQKYPNVVGDITKVENGDFKSEITLVCMNPSALPYPSTSKHFPDWGSGKHISNFHSNQAGCIRLDDITLNIKNTGTVGISTRNSQAWIEDYGGFKYPYNVGDELLKKKIYPGEEVNLQLDWDRFNIVDPSSITAIKNKSKFFFSLDGSSADTTVSWILEDCWKREDRTYRPTQYRRLNDGSYCMNEYCPIEYSIQVPENNDISSLIEIALGLIDQGKYADALAYYDTILVKSGDCCIAINNKGCCLMQLGHAKDALPYFLDASVVCPSDYRVWVNKGWCEMKSSLYEDSVNSFNKALELNSNSAEIWNDKGITLYKMGRYEAALAAFEEAIKLNPDFVWAWNNKGAAYSQLYENEKAIECYDESIKLDPNFKCGVVRFGPDNVFGDFIWIRDIYC